MNEAPKPRRRKLSLLLKAGVSAMLLVYVFRKVGWEPLWETIQGADLRFLAIHLSLAVLATLISARKWQILCRPFHFQTGLGKLFLLYLVGYLFNHIMPTNVGGDVVRGWELGRAEGRKAEAMASVFIERYTGLAILVLFALGAVTFDSRFRNNWPVLGALAFAVCGFLGISVIIFYSAPLNLLQKINRYGPIQKVLNKARKVQVSVQNYGRHPREIAWALFYSVLFYINSVFITFTGCLTFGHHPPLASMFTAVPVMMVVFMIPISLGGIGLQEWAYYAVLGRVGVPQAAGLSLGLLYRVRSMCFGLLGAAAYPLATAGGKPSQLAQQIQAND
ncbi:MAG: flippase-like domain-containing protein [Phycisphaeraceae bacterium]|nr:flippase-like domain-containing protein [Phycisphaeraceae bacterium]